MAERRPSNDAPPAKKAKREKVGVGVGIQDISKRDASLVYGVTTIAAVVAGASGQYLTGAALDATNNNFAPVLLTISAVQLAGLAAWWTWWDSSERVFE